MWDWRGCCGQHGNRALWRKPCPKTSANFLYMDSFTAALSILLFKWGCDDVFSYLGNKTIGSNSKLNLNSFNEIMEHWKIFTELINLVMCVILSFSVCHFQSLLWLFLANATLPPAFWEAQTEAMELIFIYTCWHFFPMKLMCIMWLYTN